MRDNLNQYPSNLSEVFCGRIAACMHLVIIESEQSKHRIDILLQNNCTVRALRRISRRVCQSLSWFQEFSSISISAGKLSRTASFSSNFSRSFLILASTIRDNTGVISRRYHDLRSSGILSISLQ